MAAVRCVVGFLYVCFPLHHIPQGEGGVFHNDLFKQRYFVLARVPHATVLIYYAQKCMDEDSILGYIDLRKVTTIRTVMKVSR